MAKEGLLWKAIREEVELTISSTEYKPSAQQIDEIIGAVIRDNRIWQNFNEEVLNIIEDKLG